MKPGFHSCTFPSMPAVAIWRPSGDQVTALTLSLQARKTQTVSPLRVSQTDTAPYPQDAINLPFGSDQARPQEETSCTR